MIQKRITSFGLLIGIFILMVSCEKFNNENLFHGCNEMDKKKFDEDLFGTWNFKHLYLDGIGNKTTEEHIPMKFKYDEESDEGWWSAELHVDECGSKWYTCGSNGINFNYPMICTMLGAKGKSCIWEERIRQALSNAKTYQLTSGGEILMIYFEVEETRWICDPEPVQSRDEPVYEEGQRGKLVFSKTEGN